MVRDLELKTYNGRVHTRFPPEPNGYLHIGHAKSICLNFGIARKYGGLCNLRFDDTNPASEKQEFIDSIQEDVQWLGFQWDGPARYASDYFGTLYEWALEFIERDLAYVDELSAAEISEYRGSLTTPGKDSPYRDRPKAENFEMFKKMRAGEIEPGKAVLRAKISMAHKNVIMRDPIMYRMVPDPPHPRTGSEWPMYPSYDWAHGLNDALEGITHSVCTLEFNMHNELYDWFNDRVTDIGGLKNDALPKQHEFARLEMTHIVVSKRKLKRLVEGGLVDGWDDPRMPTISGMRRRGFPPGSLRQMCALIGVSKVPTAVIRYELLESCVRDCLQEEVKSKLFCVLKPLRVVITNWPEGKADEVIEVPGEGEQPTRRLTFGREMLIEREDFMEDPVPDFKRLAPGRQVKFRHAFVITCDKVVKDESGAVTELHCSYDESSLGQKPPKGVAVVHWVHATASTPLRVRLYDKLFADPRPEEREDFLEALNKESLEQVESARCELSALELIALKPDHPVRAQFERCGWFILDVPETKKSVAAGGPPVFNRTVTLRDSFKPQGEEKKGDNRRKK